MKICDIVQFHSPLSGGVKRYIQDKSDYISRRGQKHVIVIPCEKDCVSVDGNVSTYSIKSPRIPNSKSYRLLISTAKIKSIIEKEMPDIIEVGDPYIAAWAASISAARLKIPVVAFYHSDYPRAIERSIRKCAGPFVAAVLSWPIKRYLLSLYKRMNATMAATNNTCDILKKLGVPRIVHMPLGVNTNLFKFHPCRAMLKKKLGYDEGNKLLLYVGRLAREKNISRLIDMMSIARSSKELRLLLVGDGECANTVKRGVANDSRIKWIPYCSDPAVLSEYYGAADLFVHPGTSETFGLAAAEAQVCGTRVIGIRSSGLDEVLSVEDKLIIAEKSDPAELLSAVKTALALYENDSCRLERSKKTAARFASEIAFGRLIGLYENIVGTSRNPQEKQEEAETDADCLYNPAIFPA